MIVVDASAWATALIDAGPEGDAARALLVEDPAWLAPAHAALEVQRTIRRYESAGILGAEAATRFARAVADAELSYVAAEPWLLRAAWELRHHVSAYDAPYVVLARVYDAPLVTRDRRLARAVAGLGLVTRVPGG